MRFPVGVRLPGGGGRRGAGVGAGIGGIGLIVLVLAALFLGVDPRILLQDEPGVGGAPTAYQTAPQAPRSGAENELADFVSVVLGDTEDTWRDLFQGMGRVYREPTLVLFTGAVESACGLGQAAMGPFYCPGDQRVYIDLSFYDELRSRFQAPGDFAQAYVVAHEVGHHVQNLLGISEQVHAARVGAGDPAEANALSVRLELQADCLAGVWAHHADEARQILERGDVEEALGAASAIGDDRLQRRAQGHVVPESFTHGTAEQRARWFERGLQGDTFNADDP
jgi:predicted metalloprotease